MPTAKKGPDTAALTAPSASSDLRMVVVTARKPVEGKIFTSKGPARDGSVVELPAAEAKKFHDLGLADWARDGAQEQWNPAVVDVDSPQARERMARQAAMEREARERRLQSQL